MEAVFALHCGERGQIGPLDARPDRLRLRRIDQRHAAALEAGAEAWRRGDLEAYGRLSFESGWSSIHNWESGAPEQIKLYEIMRETDGIY
ncbi:MAG: hypothetical protein IKD72_05150, partial [Clostridia bacterium]|nr:hypothetical protein [Clostridia bacterium]